MQPENQSSVKTSRILLAVFAVLTLVDVFSFRALWRGYVTNETAVQKAAFENQADGSITARAVKWGYAMFPQPYFASPSALILPPGYPMLVTTDAVSNNAFQLHVYEERAPAMIMVKATGAAHFEALLADGSGNPVLEPVGDAPPARAAFDGLVGCFENKEDIRFFFNQGPQLTVTAGRCKWTVATSNAQVLVDPFAASARLELETAAAFASLGTRWWLVLLVMLASIIHRFSMKNASWVGTDATATLFVCIASAVTPLFVVIWCAKGILGLLIAAWQVLSLARRNRRWRMALGSLAAVGVVLALTVDPRKVWELNTVINERVSDDGHPSRLHGRSAARPPDATTHLVLGYSMVNGAALDKGAYGDGALDSVLQKTCGDERIHFARHALDGANGCFMRKAWNDLTPGMPSLKQRIYFGGFNDDLTAPATRLSVWISTIVGVLPTRNPYPRPLTLWGSAATSNLDTERMADLMSCVEELAANGGNAPLMHVYDLASFDLGHPRLWNREVWMEARRKAVESHGGKFVDMRTLLPRESPVYFNDVSHLSEVGYQALARGLCALMQGDTTALAPQR